MELKDNKNKLNNENDSMDHKLNDENAQKVSGGTFTQEQLIRNIEEIINKSESNRNK